MSSGELKVVLSNAASGNFVDADGVLIIPDGPIHGAVSKTPPPAISIGTVPSASTTKSQKTSVPTVSINGVTGSGSLNVTYHQNPPAQTANSSSSSLVDLALIDLANDGAIKKKGQS